MARRRRNPVLTWIVTSSCIAFGAVTARLPLPVCRFIGRSLGRIAYHLVPRIRRVALANLDIAYGDSLDRAAKRRLARASAENVGIVAAEFSHILEFEHGLLEREVTILGADNLDPAAGAIFIGAHLGNWEWMAAATPSVRADAIGIVRPLDDPRLDRLISSIRSSTGAKIVSKHGAGVEVTRRVREGWVTGILIDQNPRKNAIPITFYDQETWGTIGPAIVAARTHAPVYPVSMVRQENGSYIYQISPPLDLASTGSLRNDLVVNTERCHAAVEAQIREHPEQWLWFHRRFKPRPELAKEHEARTAKAAEKG
ncbi:MAG: lysophospholipid acyltransferase family protein [bacterium]|nr:lysophospholipid acyltransferase family protein [bacterium]